MDFESLCRHKKMSKHHGEHQAFENLTLSAVHKLQRKLQYIEQSLILNNSAAAAEPLPTATQSCSHGDVSDLESPGAEGAARGRAAHNAELLRIYGSEVSGSRERRRKKLRETETYRSGLSSPQRQSSRKHDSHHAHWSHSAASPQPVHFSSHGKSRRLPLTYRPSDLNYNCNATAESPPIAVSVTRVVDETPKGAEDVNQVALGSPAPPPPPAPPTAKEPPAPTETPQKLKVPVVTVGLGLPDRQKEGSDETGSVTKVHGNVPHLAMSKRQLLDEIRKEKDEHRKNVRSVTSER
jgi:hypothetical protein